jgi:hypothetical protein
MTRTLKMKNICCLFFVGDNLKRVRFKPLRKSGFQALQRLGKQFASINRSIIRRRNRRQHPGLWIFESNSRWGARRCGRWALAAATSYHLLVGRHPAEGPLGPRIGLQARPKVRRSIRDISAWGFMSVIRSGADPSPIEWSYPLCANG